MLVEQHQGNKVKDQFISFLEEQYFSNMILEILWIVSKNVVCSDFNPIGNSYVFRD